MKKAWVLSKLYINSLYGFSGFANDLKINRKSAVKKLLFLLLIGLGFSGTVGMLIAFNAKMFDILKPMGQQRVVITLSIIAASVITLVFGIIGTIATYFVDKEGDLILSMPLKPWHILTSKIASNYIYEAILGTIIMATGFIVYGIKDGAGVLFYLFSILISLFIPIIPLTIGYLIVIPLMRAGSILRKKDFTMIMTGVIAMIFAFGIQYFSQMLVKVGTNPQAIAAKLTDPNGLVSIIGNIYYPSILATYGIVDSGTFSGLLNALVFIAISLAVVAALISIMAYPYSASIVGSQEVSKSRKFTQGEFKQRLKVSGVLGALVNREIKLMNREPVFLLNGPLVILLIPAIMGFALYMQKGELVKALEGVKVLKDSSYYMTLIFAGISVFLGISVNITSTCISREGKTFELLKSMPIEPRKYFNAKLIHGFIFGALASLMSSLIGIIGVGVDPINALLSFVLALVVMSPILIFGIIIELTWPKLLWDNPQKAMKQNMNSVIIVLGSMCLIPLLGLIVYKFLTSAAIIYSTLFIVPLIISGILYKVLLSYGVKRFYEIEL